MLKVLKGILEYAISIIGGLIRVAIGYDITKSVKENIEKNRLTILTRIAFLFLFPSWVLFLCKLYIVIRVFCFSFKFKRTSKNNAEEAVA